MNCYLNRVIALIVGAIAALLSAIGLANLWPTAYPLFGAAAVVAGVAYVAIPAIKKSLFDYAACRGGPGKCVSSLNLTIDTLVKLRPQYRRSHLLRLVHYRLPHLRRYSREFLPS